LPVCTSSLGSETVLSHDLPGACPLRPPHQNFRPVAHLFAPLHCNDYWSQQAAIRFNYKSVFALYFAFSALQLMLWLQSYDRLKFCATDRKFGGRIQGQNSMGFGGRIRDHVIFIYLLSRRALKTFVYLLFRCAPKTFLNNTPTYHQPSFCRCV